MPDGDEVKLLHFNKVAFSIKIFIKGIYPFYSSRNFSMNLGRVIFENNSQFDNVIF